MVNKVTTFIAIAVIGSKTITVADSPSSTTKRESEVQGLSARDPIYYVKASCTFPPTILHLPTPRSSYSGQGLPLINHNQDKHSSFLITINVIPVSPVALI